MERDIFYQALDLEGEEREGYLRDLQRRDPELHAKILRLLRASQESSFLEVSPFGPALEEGRAAPPPSPSLPANEKPGSLAGTVLGDYQLEKVIAVGGIGIIYRARQISLNRPVAIKVLGYGQLASAADIQRFRAEAEAVASLDHPNVIPVYEVGEAAGHHFFSMKLIEGPNLAEVVHEYTARPSKAVALMARIARAVHHANQRGILHRDLKPSNILLEGGTIPYVADFGIAKRLDATDDITREDWICGTPWYMAPEQVSPAIGRITARTDVYSLGCIFYELLTGKRPLGGDSIAETLHAILKVTPEPPGSIRIGLPRDLEAICMKCLSKEPWLRYDSAAELAEDLERWLESKPIQARKTGLLERMVLFWHRKPMVTTLTAIVVFLVFIIAVGASVMSLQLQSHLDRAVEAEAAATERLRNSLVAQASANRRTGMAGRQRQSLELLTQAAAIDRGPELRNEALAALALTDLEVEAEWPLDEEPYTIYAFSPVGDRYARGFHDGRLAVRNVGGGDDFVRMLPGIGDPVWLARFSGDGRWLLGRYRKSPGSTGPAAILWDLSDGSKGWRSDLEISSASVEFHPHLPQLLLATDQSQLLALDLATGRELWRIDLPERTSNLDIRPDGRLLAAGLSGSGRTLVYDLNDQRLVRSFSGSAPVGDVSWSHDGALLAAVYLNHLGTVWEFDTGRELVSLRGHQAEIVYANFLPTGPVLQTYSWDETTRLWDPYTGEELVVADRRGYRFSKDGRKLFFLTTETAGYWRVRQGEILRRVYGHVDKNPRAVYLSTDGNLMASVGTDQTILWDTSRLARVGSLPGSQRFLGFAFRGNVFYSCGPDGLGGTSYAYRPDTGQFIVQQTRRLSSAPCDYGAVDSRERVVATFKEMGATLDVAFIHSAETAALDLAWPREGVHISPDGRLAASGNWRGTGVRVWDLVDKKVLIDLIPERIAVRVSFSPDGRWLAAGTNREYLLWNVGDWSQKAEIRRPLDYSNLPGRVDFSPDGRFMAITGSERLLMLLTVPDLQPVAELETPGHQEFNDLRFSHDGSRLYVATTNGQVQIWDLAAAQARLQELQLEDSEVIFSTRPASD